MVSSLIRVTATLTALFFLGGFGRVAKGVEQPNIILLVADDLGYGELGCQGNAEIPTPHIDSISANGTRFTQGYVTAPNCSTEIEIVFVICMALYSLALNAFFRYRLELCRL